MAKILLVIALLLGGQAHAVDFVLGIGPDVQLSNNKLSPRGTFDDPEDEAKIGGAFLMHLDIPLSERIGLRTGTELVQRYLKQDYDGWWWSDDNGHTRYDVLSVDIPFYFEVYLGGGKHTIYAGPKLAVTIYDHCGQTVDDPASVYPCQDNAVKEIFVPFQVGYIIKFTDFFGLNVFTEYSLTNIVDSGALESKLFRGGVTAQFYF